MVVFVEQSRGKIPRDVLPDLSDMEGTLRVRKRDLARMFVRSFYLQAALNYERMQSLGFAAAMVPVMNRICRSREERMLFLQRHLEFFNAHPYFASFALGASARLEEAGDRQSGEQVRLLKKGLCGPLGALGDQIFWNGLLPMAGIIGAMLSFRQGIWGPVLFLCVYNLPHLWIRYRGLKRGYQLGQDVSRELTGRLYTRAKKFMQMAGAVMVGLYIGSEAGRLAQLRINRLFIFLLCIIFCWFALKRRFSMYLLVPALVLAGVLIMYFLPWFTV